MHSWRSFHVNKRYQFYRLFIISSMVSMLVFIMLYLVTLPVATEPFTDEYFLIFLIVLVLLYPLHKFCHLLPFLSRPYRNFIYTIDFYFFIVPILDIKLKDPISKRRFTAGLLCPFLAINIPLIVCIFILPEYIHYVTILLAFHVGICFVDLIYLKALFSSPKHALIEENEDGYEILVNDIDINTK